MTHQTRATIQRHSLAFAGFGTAAWIISVSALIGIAALAAALWESGRQANVQEARNVPTPDQNMPDALISGKAEVQGFSFCQTTDPTLGDQPFVCWQNLNDGDTEGEDGAVIMRNGGTPYAVFSFNRAHGVSRVRVLTDVGTGNRAQWLKDFRVEVSEDGSQYREVLQGVKAQAPGFEEFPLPPNVTARYVKVLFASNYGDKAWTQVGEGEVYGVGQP